MPAIRRVVNFVLNNRGYERAGVSVTLSPIEHAKMVVGRWLRAPLERDSNGIRMEFASMECPSIVLMDRQPPADTEAPGVIYITGHIANNLGLA